MDRFISRKRPRLSPSASQQTLPPDEDSTDMKLAILLSLFPGIEQDALLDILISSGGSVEDASAVITAQRAYRPVKKRTGGVSAIQTSMTSHITTEAGLPPKRQLTRKGKTLHLFSPEDVAAHTPCTIIHNFLPPDEADALLLELLDESKHFSRYRFQLFDRTVESPHTSSLYVATPEEIRQQTSEYTYGGRYRSNVRQLTPYLRAVSAKVQRAVNDEVQKRIRACYPDGKKLKYQSPKEWVPNAAFVNCYDGPAESVGYHSDELTYLGPRAIIGSLSLGVEREFRVRRIVASDDDEGNDSEVSAMGLTADSPSRRKVTSKGIDGRADAQGQISIHLPHNSLLVMHAEMQEEWKHAIVPAQTVSPHPLSGNRRINVTYRWYRDSLHPRNIPQCRCGTHAILRCVQRKRENKGRYMWMCYAGHEPGKKGCTFFQWAEFDDDGEPLWEIKPTEGGATTLRNFIEEDDKQ
jgi:alkylated DNA repair dioxygenase AlkB